MIDFLVTHQALMREWINGVAFILLLTLTCMISVFLWDTWVEWQWPRREATASFTWVVSYQDWSHVPGVPTACALWWVFAAEAYRTCNVWVAYNQGKIGHGGPLGQSIGVGVFASSSSISAIGYLLAGVIFCLGLLRAIYIFTPPDWKSRVWIWASVAALIFVAVPTIWYK